MATDKKEQTGSGEEEKAAGFKFDPKVGIPVILVQAVLAYFLASFVIVPTFFAPVSAEEAQAEAEDDGEFGVAYIVEDVIVNPDESGGSRYVVVNVAFEVKDEGDASELETKDVKLRDMLIRSLGSRTIDQLDGPDDKEQLRQEILENVGKLLPRGHLKNVYFVNYILQ